MGPPKVTPDNLDVQMKGEVFETAHRTTPPFSPPPLSLPDDHNLMVYFAVSDYLFNTAGFVYQSAGKLVFNVTDDMVPKGSPVRLNTSSFGLMIPQLAKMYPDMLMKLIITSDSAPSLNISPGNVSMAPLLNIQAYAILPNSSLAPLFLLNLKTDVIANVAVSSSRIVGNLKLSRVDIELKHSDVGPFPVGLIQTAVNFYLSTVLLPKVNEKLNEGYPLPLLDHVLLENIILKQYEYLGLEDPEVDNICPMDSEQLVALAPLRGAEVVDQNHPEPENTQMPPLTDHQREELPSCNICLEVMQEGAQTNTLTGSHQFHIGCITRWMQGNLNCPICRQESFGLLGYVAYICQIFLPLLPFMSKNRASYTKLWTDDHHCLWPILGQRAIDVCSSGPPAFKHQSGPPKNTSPDNLPFLNASQDHPPSTPVCPPKHWTIPLLNISPDHFPLNTSLEKFPILNINLDHPL
ncbi:PREDICTED: bactericidal permeability-increasing protein-like [Nanorana parkeri]|uniref:bactericidal permeability-increasing protein-like n=1 Tax=Nanorana parkeri TaxID=125878 RepID=UPI0008549421|nr:PREDICTED: bactericidal permeability-increasing protein-like [Nanorana parkeri]